MNKKIIIITWIVVLVLLAFLFYFIYNEKIRNSKNTIQSNIIEEENNEVAEENEQKNQEEEIVEEIIVEEEILTESEKLTVSSSDGSVVEITENSITINNEGKIKKYNFVNKNELGVFKKSGEDVIIINIADIKIGDKVILEARQKDGFVNVIMVEAE